MPLSREENFLKKYINNITPCTSKLPLLGIRVVKIYKFLVSCSCLLIIQMQDLPSSSWEDTISLASDCFVCSSHSRIVHSYGDVTITGDGLQILTYARHSRLSSEGSWACHTNCDTGHPFIMVIAEDPWHSHLMPSVKQWSCHYLFLRLGSVAPSIRSQALSGH